MIDITNEKDMLVEAEQERAAAEASARVARQAERLEQDRKVILELVANDQPLEQVAATMADAVANHLPGTLCAIRLQVPGDEQIALFPMLPGALAEALSAIPLESIREALRCAPIEQLSESPDWQRFIQSATDLSHRFYRVVTVMRESARAGIILALFTDDRADEAQQRLLESWGRFASLAVERRGLYKQLSFRAQYDSLTNLLNRASLYEQLNSLLRQHARTPGCLAILYLDLDCFKEINDTFGHMYGDKVLQHVAARIQERVRRSDVVARIGGDEFVVLLPNVSDRSEALQIAQTIANAIAGPVDVDGRLIAIGASLGISVCPLDGTEPEALLKVADESMYQAKLTRRSRRALLAQKTDNPTANFKTLADLANGSGK
jgi:diguanylate cyclase (GGDEF)-like protein